MYGMLIDQKRLLCCMSGWVIMLERARGGDEVLAVARAFPGVRAAA
jgi:hypothetical protein